MVLEFGTLGLLGDQVADGLPIVEQVGLLGAIESRDAELKQSKLLSFTEIES